MQNVKITRYSRPLETGWAGYLEPEDKSWIAFIGLNGVPRFFLNRDPASGAIMPDDLADHAAHLEELRTIPGRRIGMIEDGSSGLTSLAVGERVFPLGEDGRSRSA